MSWSLRIIGKNRDKVIDGVHRQVTGGAYPTQPHPNDKIAEIIKLLLDCLPENERLGVDVESNGYIDPQGWGNAVIKIGSIPIADDLEIANPPVGVEKLCLVCAFVKPWGVFDSKTGAVVCVECRDKARS
jgi:hypothetical protein